MDDALASRAYEDTSLPIGHGQTISQPYIVAKMTELLIDQRHLKNVLEIGTGAAGCHAYPLYRIHQGNHSFTVSSAS
jgi:protein-L-isoaspartate O-methyltransferase